MVKRFDSHQRLWRNQLWLLSWTLTWRRRVLWLVLCDLLSEFLKVHVLKDVFYWLSQRSCLVPQAPSNQLNMTLTAHASSKWLLNWLPTKPMCNTRSFYSEEPRTNRDSCTARPKNAWSLRRRAINSRLQNRYSLRWRSAWDQAIQFKNTHLARTPGRHPENKKRDKPVSFRHNQMCLLDEPRRLLL